jgi:hypothetical protein
LLLVVVLDVASVVMDLLLSPAEVCCWQHVSSNCATQAQG